jgi:hypothetical protein
MNLRSDINTRTDLMQSEKKDELPEEEDSYIVTNGN